MSRYSPVAETYHKRVQHFTSDDGALLALTRLGGHGAAPALVISGGPCREPTYVGDLAGLAEMRPLAVLHPRGTPASGGLSRGWWNDAGDVVAAADHLGVDRVDVIAHSAGTRLALAAATQHGERIRSLALITPAAAWLTGTPHDGREIARRRTEPAMTTALASMDGPQPTDQATFMRSLKDEAAAGYAHWTATEQAHASVGRWSWEASSAWASNIPDDVAARVSAAAIPPAHVVAGSEDILTGVRPVEAYARALGASLTMLEDCGHYPWVERPREFREAMDGWFDSLR